MSDAGRSFRPGAARGEGIAPNGPADRRKLIRRAYFDLIGLPPTPEEVEAFVNDPAPDAYERLVDRLLATPALRRALGPALARPGALRREPRLRAGLRPPDGYHYRDFVIEALNQDMPYDTVRRSWQLAGDELEPNNPLALMATGFLAAGMHATQITANQVEKERYDELDDMAGTSARRCSG